MRIEELTDDDKGRAVIWKERKGIELTDRGVITSWNDRFIFVRYGSDLHSKATNPSELQFETEAEHD